MIHSMGFNIIVIAMGVIFYLTAGKIYDSHRNTRENFPLIFKLTGLNVRYIDTKEMWVKCFRRQVILVVILFLAVMVMNVLV